MSCGHPHEVDCSDVIEAVYLYLDGEMDDSGIARIRQHLDECSPCLREYGIEHEVQVLIARSCCERAPDALRQAVMMRLREVRTEITRTEYLPE